MHIPILSTKLYIPDMREDHVVRSALVEKLASGIRANHKLTLVSAPAGYGKTTLVLELLRSMNLNTSWISLDDGDNDLTQFLLYLIAALKKAGIHVGAETEALVVDLGLSAAQAPMTIIINELSGISEKMILVLDDFHLINSPQVYDVLKYLIDHQPPNFHLIIITREDPRLPLANLRAQRKISEVRMEDLSFSVDEARDFFKGFMGLELSDDAVKTIESRTEGWIAGLQLAGLSLSGCGKQDIDEFIKVFNDTHRYIIDYLVEEVINGQTEEVRQFLCQTSILDRMSSDLCDYITEKTNSKQILRDIEKANLFLIPLDSKREWYRYHHLFADSLRSELSDRQEKELHKKAALWLFDNGFRQESVRYALKSGDMQLSLKLIEDNTEQAFRNAQLTTLVKWMNAVPEELIRENDILGVRKAWALLVSGNISEAIRYFNTLGEEYFERTTPHNKGLILSFKAILCQRMGDENAESFAQKALEFLEPWDPISRISTLNTLARAQEMRGATHAAHQTFVMAYNEGRKLGYSLITTIATANLGASLNILGKRKEALDIYTGYIEGMIGEYGKPLAIAGQIYIGLASLYYDSHELLKAKEYMDKGLELCHSISYHWTPFTPIMEANLKFALGERDTAIEGIKNVLRESVLNMTGATIRYMGVLTDLLLRSGQLQYTEQYEGALLKYVKDTGSGTFEEAVLPYAKLLVYKKSVDEALRVLDYHQKEAAGKEKLRVLIEIYILKAEAYAVHNDFDRANEYLDRAILLAEPQQYVQLFINEEEKLGEILLHRKKPAAEFLNVITGNPERPAVVASLNYSDQYRNSPDKLSQREIEILGLLGKGLSNNEIAKTLYISTNTTQWHISHIYSKLDVKSRTQAVLKARELGIL